MRKQEPRRINPNEMGRLRDLIESLPTRFQTFAPQNDMSGKYICHILLLCISAPFTGQSERRRTLCSFGKEAQYPIDLFVLKPPVDPRMKLGEIAVELNERLHEIHREVQITMGTEQRRQREYFSRKVHGNPFKDGDLVWLFEPHKVKSRIFYLF